LAGKLKVDRHFSACPVDEDDELYPNGIFVFNITKLSEFIQNNPDSFRREEVMVKDFPGRFSSLDESHLADADLSRPVILAEIAPGRFNVIDGNYRMEVARRSGIQKIPAYRLGPEVHLKFLTTEKGYLAYIEYWNGKLKATKQ
jgi:hypothetical protein